MESSRKFGSDMPASDYEMMHKSLDKRSGITFDDENMKNLELMIDAINTNFLRQKMAIIQETIKELSPEQKDESQTIFELGHLLKIIREQIDIEDHIRPLTKLKIKRETVTEDLEDGEEWKEGTDYARTHQEISVNPEPKSKENELAVESLMMRRRNYYQEFNNAYTKFEHDHPAEYLILETAFENAENGGQENRTN